MSSTSSSSHRLHVVTYNILSSKLADPAYHVGSTPLTLDIDYRYSLLIIKLEQQMRRAAIVCLQEVDEAFLTRLTPFFQVNGYAIHYKTYSNWGGVLIAWPKSEYTIVNDVIDDTVRHDIIGNIIDNGHFTCKIGDHIRQSLVVKPCHKFCIDLYEWCLQHVIRRILLLVVYVLATVLKLCFLPSLWLPDNIAPAIYKRFTPSDDPWMIAIHKSQYIIGVRLKRIKYDDDAFCVFNYHMPCDFRRPDVMLIHAIAVKDVIFEWSKGLPCIFVGDMNSKPDDVAMKYLVKSSPTCITPIPKRSNRYTSYTHTLLSESSQGLTFSSAYKEYNGKEPPFTCISQVAGAPFFKDTLDYILCTGNHWRVIDTLVLLPCQKTTPVSQPSDTEPSDHLLLAAILTRIHTGTTSE